MGSKVATAATDSETWPCFFAGFEALGSDVHP